MKMYLALNMHNEKLFTKKIRMSQVGQSDLEFVVTINGLHDYIMHKKFHNLLIYSVI